MVNFTPIGLQLQWHYWTSWDYFGKPTKKTANRPNWKGKRRRKKLKWRKPKELALRRRVWNRWYTWVLLSSGDWAFVLQLQLGCHLGAEGKHALWPASEKIQFEIRSAVLKPRWTWINTWAVYLCLQNFWVGQVVYLYIVDVLLPGPTESCPNSTGLSHLNRHINHGDNIGCWPSSPIKGIPCAGSFNSDYGFGSSRQIFSE